MSSQFKTLRRWYNTSLRHPDQCDQMKEETIKGLITKDKIVLDGKLHPFKEQLSFIYGRPVIEVMCQKEVKHGVENYNNEVADFTSC